MGRVAAEGAASLPRLRSAPLDIARVCPHPVCSRVITRNRMVFGGAPARLHARARHEGGGSG